MKSTRTARTAGLVAAAAIAGGIAGVAAGLFLGGESEPGPATTEAVVLSPEAVYERSAPGVVAIRGSRADGSGPALGSGFVVDDRGDIATSYGVVAGSTAIRVGLGGGAWYPATVVGLDPSAGIAVIRVDSPAAALHPLAFERSGPVAVGDSVYAIGGPAGLDPTMTAGIVSSVGRTIGTDAAIAPAGLGGPLLDRFGRVVGVSVRAGSVVPAETARRAIGRVVTEVALSTGSLGVA